MKPTVVFVRVVGKPEYEPGAQRLAESYRKHRPKMAHDVVMIERYADGDESLNDVATIRVRYDGGGWDCGAWQFAAKNIDAELLICFNSTTTLQGDGWLERFVDAFTEHGEGLYGPMASLEVAPHIRTPCMAFSPAVMNAYPMTVNTREETYQFESMGFGGIPNVSLFTRNRGLPVKMVTWSGVYDLLDCRQPANVFRSGDQSDLIVKDKHAEHYETSDPSYKAYLESLTRKK